jgi:hypothetical protein
LFDQCERSNDGYKKRAESLYAFLNRCAGAEWDAVRRGDNAATPGGNTG